MVRVRERKRREIVKVRERVRIRRDERMRG